MDDVSLEQRMKTQLDGFERKTLFIKKAMYRDDEISFFFIIKRMKILKKKKSEKKVLHVYCSWKMKKKESSLQFLWF